MQPTLQTNRSSSLHFLILLIGAIVCPYFSIHAQNIFTMADQLNEQYKQEKIYLHIDRPSYWANEDMWFKAYLKDSPQEDCNLYVELLNEKGGVVYKKVCWAQKGMAYGDFHLEDTLSSGMYQVRAYTNWMRNFDEQWFFRRDLLIWNLRDKAKPMEPQELKEKKIDFRFFPEGGTFIAGIKNKVAFKAVDTNGKGLEVKGVVLDDKGRQVAMIKSGFKGMGSFEITPETGKKYSAELTVAGNISMKPDLPEALPSGISLSFDVEDTSHVHLEIHSKDIASNGKYLLVGQSEGKVCYKEEVSVNALKAVVEINKEKLPTGIVRFTLFDSNSLPLCERLVFVNNHDQVNLVVQTQELTYHPREKVILDIFALDNDKNPILADLSLSAYHTETIHQSEQYPENILTSFLLSSELKGRIEEPAYYFKDDSISTLVALDNVMLTHGYRYFQWKQVMEKEQPSLAYQPESGIQLKGTVLSDLLHRPVANAKVKMISIKSSLEPKDQTTDEKGRFVFPDLFFNDTMKVVLQMQKENGKAVSGIRIDTSAFVSPKVSILPMTYNYSRQENSQTVTYISELSPELLNRKWRLSDTILLADVNVMLWKGKKWDGIFRPYLEPDLVVDFKKLDDIYFNYKEALRINYPLFRIFIEKEAQFFIDGMFDRYGKNRDLDFNEIDKVEFVRYTDRPGFGYGPAIFIYLKKEVTEKIEYAPGLRPVTFTGFSVVRTYYSPQYDGTDNDKKSDHRSSLYWEPMVKTDMEGKTSVSFYNSDQTGKVQVVVEGLTSEGKICRGEYQYMVVPRSNKERNTSF